MAYSRIPYAAEQGIVVVTGRAQMEVIVEGKPKLLNSRYTNVWIKGAKGWQMVVWQSTAIPAAPA